MGDVRNGSMRAARHQVLMVPVEFLFEVLKEGRRSVIEVARYGLPADARLVRAYWDAPSNAFALVVESESFYLTPPGDAVALIPRPVLHYVDREGERPA